MVSLSSDPGAVAFPDQSEIPAALHPSCLQQELASIPGPLSRHGFPPPISSGHCFSLRMLPMVPYSPLFWEQPATYGLPEPYKRPQWQWLSEAGEPSIMLQEGYPGNQRPQALTHKCWQESHTLTKVHLQDTGCSSQLLLTKAISRVPGFSIRDGPSSPYSSSLSWEDLQFPSPVFSFCQPLQSASLPKGQSDGTRREPLVLTTPSP